MKRFNIPAQAKLIQQIENETQSQFKDNNESGLHLLQPIQTGEEAKGQTEGEKEQLTEAPKQAKKGAQNSGKSKNV